MFSVGSSKHVKRRAVFDLLREVGSGAKTEDHANARLGV